MKQSTLPWRTRKGTLAPNAVPGSQTLWEDDPQWVQLKRSLENCSCKLQVIELCGGLGTAFLALRMILPIHCTELVGHWDTDFDLAQVLNAVHPDATDRLHLGSIEGDILKWDIAQFPNCHVLVAGPPCPPFSKLGRKQAFEDPRATVLWRCIDICTHLATNGPLILFVLENVDGLRSRQQGAAQSPCDIIMQDLVEGLDADWSVSAISCNSLDYGLPQRRPRTYIIARRISLTGKQEPRVPQFESRVPLHRFLDTHDTSDVLANTDLQQRNLTDWKQWYKSTFPEHNESHDYAVVDISRTPTARTTWSSKGTPPGIVQCLTTSGPNLHVFALQAEHDNAIDRRLRTVESARLQGFPPSVCDMVRESKEWKRFIGNAMSVPVIGIVLATQINNMIECGSGMFARCVQLRGVAISSTDHASLATSTSTSSLCCVPHATSEAADAADCDDCLLPKRRRISTQDINSNQWCVKG